MEVNCPSCQARLALADSAAGKRALCPSCEAEFRVPALGPPDRGDGPVEQLSLRESLIRCPACERTLAFDPAMAGQMIICPTCQRRMRMPTASEQGADPVPSPSIQKQAGRWTAPLDQTTTAMPTSYEENPYAPMPPGGAVVLSDVRTNYALPGFFLVAIAGPSLFFVGASLVWVLLALMMGGGAVAGVAELYFYCFFLVLALLSHIATFTGGMQMIRRRRLDLARLGAWAALYPCGFCFVLQIPFAIWALVLLHRSSAPADFQSPADHLSQRLA